MKLFNKFRREKKGVIHIHFQMVLMCLNESKDTRNLNDLLQFSYSIHNLLDIFKLICFVVVKNVPFFTWKFGHKTQSKIRHSTKHATNSRNSILETIAWLAHFLSENEEKEMGTECMIDRRQLAMWPRTDICFAHLNSLNEFSSLCIDLAKFQYCRHSEIRKYAIQYGVIWIWLKFHWYHALWLSGGASLAN